MANNEVLNKGEIRTEFEKIGNLFFSLHCINDNIRLLAEGLAYKDED